MNDDPYLEDLDTKIATAKARLEELDHSRRAYVEKLQHAEIDRVDTLMADTHVRLKDLEQPMLEAWNELHEAIRNACTKLKLCGKRDDGGDSGG